MAKMFLQHFPSFTIEGLSKQEVNCLIRALEEYQAALYEACERVPDEAVSTKLVVMMREAVRQEARQ